MLFEDEKRAVIERKRNILYLISKYLSDIGLNETNQTLVTESNLSSDYVICDNIDLDTIYLEFTSYHQLKFGKLPNVLKKLTVGQSSNRRPSKPVPKTMKIPEPIKVGEKNGKGSISSSLIISPLGNAIDETPQAIESCDGGDYVAQNYNYINLNLDSYPNEWREIAQIVCTEIVKNDMKIRWTDVYGADEAITALHEGIIYPFEYPDLYEGNVRPWRSVLIHGPPGTGKTLLAKALCSETFGKLTFFNISPSSITSKWRGDSEKIVRILFDIAKRYAPSIIYVDEIDCLTSQRDKISEHEASKRFKNEFLTLMDGLESDNAGIFILGTTNLPWEIDYAFLRRFEKKILLQLPKTAERTLLIKKFLPNHQNLVTDDRMHELADLSQGFSGDEIRIACKEIKMMEIREKIKAKTEKQRTQKIIFNDFVSAFKQIKPISIETMRKHENWSRKQTDNV